MEEAKPADGWDLIIDPNLKHNVPAQAQAVPGVACFGQVSAQETGSAGSPGDTFPEETESVENPCAKGQLCCEATADWEAEEEELTGSWGM